MLLHRSSWYYQPHGQDDTVLRCRLRQFAHIQVRYGCQHLFALLQREGWLDNHKFIQRLYWLDELHLRSKCPKRSQAAAQ